MEMTPQVESRRVVSVWGSGRSDCLAAVDDEGGAGGEGGVVGAQPQHGGGDLLWLAETADGFVGDESFAPAGSAVAEAEDHLGVDDAGAQSIDTDACGGVVEGRGASEADDAVFGGGVGSLAFESLDPGAGGDVDDRPAAVLPEHLADLRPGAQERTGEADAEDAVPVVLGGVGRGLDGLLNAGVVERGVQAPETLDGLVDSGLDVFLTGDVTGQGEGFPSVRLEEAGSLPQALGGPVDEGDLRAGAGEGQGGGAADAGGCARDERALAVKIVGDGHAGLSFDGRAVARSGGCQWCAGAEASSRTGAAVA